MNKRIYWAEFDTDKFIRETYFPDFSYKGIMVEVGAGPTEFYSMSKHFRESGWRCIGVEPNPKFVQAHLSEGNEVYAYACANFEGKSNFTIVESGWDFTNEGISYSALEIKYAMPTNHNSQKVEVDVIRLETLLNRLKVTEVDFISVDTEGWELEVIEGIDLDRYKPKVVLLENYENNSNYANFMLERGYSLAHKVEYNWIFTR